MAGAVFDLSGRGARDFGAGLAAALQRALPVIAPPSAWDERPIRAELFSVERLEEHARSLAAAQGVAPGPIRGAALARRLADNEAVLVAAYRDVAAAIAEDAAITPAAEWLIDNFHVVEQQIRTVRSDLPAGYYRQLPKLATGPFAGLPRVFGLAWAFVAHTDSLFDPEVLRRYVRAYQEVQPLTIGELWAVAITLRVVLVENLRRLAARVVASRAARQHADALADRLLGAGGREAEAPEAVLADYELRAPAEAFFVQLVQRLRDQDPRLAPALAWIDDKLASEGSSPEAAVREEHQRQVSGSITVRNIITSMRLISTVDWTELMERLSLVDDVLTAGGRYAETDFPTRNLYRDAIEDLARGSGRTELDVARAAVLAAGAAGPVDPEGVEARYADPGYYLIAAGRPQFEAATGYRPPIRAWAGRVYRSLGIGGYVAAGAAVGAAVLAAPLIAMAAAGIDWPWLAALAALGLVPAIDVAVALVNHAVTRGFRATLLPALALKAGVPASLRTLVAVPTLLTTPKAIDELVERLEIHFLTCPEGEVYFALLTDWGDSDVEHTADDDALLAVARERIAALNARYGPAPAGDRFRLLHRRRVWTASEGRWMGWERKRGKLAELNRLLRGAKDTTYIEPASAPQNVRYVVTLDADTRLPRETVRRLIGKMAHPLNRPRLDPELGRVVEGYAVLQPRVTPSLPVGRQGSLFLKVFSSASGIDPYAAAVSDVYQDLFGEGTYTGKGVYDIDAFEAALTGRVPDSTLLSHDLFEGVFARSGLASDVEVVEDFPARYDAAALRHHRWARGDWQLLPWVLGNGPPGAGAAARRHVPMIGRWKMLDNLRRSVSPPATVAALLAGWAAPDGAGPTWTAFVLATMAVPPLLPLLAELGPPPPGVPLTSRLRTLAADLRLALMQLGLMLVFLAHQAWLMGDAILRTLARLVFTHRRLLEWTPAAHAAFGANPNLGRFYSRMWGALVIAVGAVAVALYAGRGHWPIATAFALAWAASPAVALSASLSPVTEGRRPIAPAGAEALRLTARRTWRFFEAFVDEASNHLPPDNFQETPEPVVARRTSPTNIGLYLLSVVAARDFGWIGALEALERIEATLRTLQRLDLYRGHLYNWYDTHDLRPLDPRYVSSVDSGNLAGHLIALASALREWAGAPIAQPRGLAGGADALRLLGQALAELPVAPAALAGGRRRLAAEIEAFGAELADAKLQNLPRLRELHESLADAVRAVAIEEDEAHSDDLMFWVEAVHRALVSCERDVTAPGDTSPRLEALAAEARGFALAMDFRFLLDPDRTLLSIGYQAVEATRDPNCYDLLASEARLASFLAIAKGDAPPRHWFRLGHAVTQASHGAVLISWSGSMFEYLMPALVMRAPSGSLLDETDRLVVAAQVDYGRRIGLPWGVSESAFNARDLEFTYQYSNFGVPGLGLKRGLADNRVVAPYATALAAMVDAGAAVSNLERLAALGARGRYGYYEAIDFTPSRVPEDAGWAIVQAFMAHHQGMSIVAIADALHDGRMRARFHADPMVQATELLLQERIPRDVVATPPSVAESAGALRRSVELAGWRSANPWSATPDVQILSNGRYSVMLTAAGAGYSAWRGLAVTRWREDATCDDWGSFIYLRDVRTDEVWSPTLQPTCSAPDDYSVVFNEDRAEFLRRDGGLSSGLEVLVSAEDDAEVRRLTLSNAGVRPREIEVTSYAELVLAPPAADRAHPAFSKLFVETEHLPGLGALLATRRRRAPDEPEVWAAHVAVVEGEVVGKREFETDRARFVGRGRSVHAPIAAINGRPLAGATGPVLDPIFALRRRLRLAPGESARIDFWTMVADTREAVLDLVDKHHDPGAFGRAAALAWTQTQVQLRHLGVERAQAGVFQRLAGHLVYAAAALRPPSEVIQAGAGGQPGLWSLGVSGDLPIMLVRIGDPLQIGLAREALLAVEYLRLKRLAVDLVILNERSTSYVADLQAELETLVRASQSRPQMGDEPSGGHIYMLRADLVPEETRALLTSIARVVLVGDRGRLGDQLEHALEPRAAARAIRWRAPDEASDLRVQRPPADIEFFNGLGGFSADGSEYVTIIAPGQSTPAPWVNVIANPNFGFQVSADGGGYAWSVSSREHQLTPWSNDPVTDPAGHALYVRDLESGEIWTATATPVRDDASAYVARHGFGYSRFEHAAGGLALSQVDFVAADDPVRITRLQLRNASTRTRRLSVTGYVEWALGPSREANAPFIATRLDPETSAMTATNAWSPAFAARVAFVDMLGRQQSWTGDRREFVGRNGSLAAPLALAENEPLSGRLGAGLDPCAALQTTLELAPGAAGEVVFVLGDAESEPAARALIARYRAADLGAVLAETRGRWESLLGAVRVKTPDRAMDLMLNGWLLYQTLGCRLWARAGFYQASGAYGFRDQLQDVMALAPLRPELTRAQILRAAARQFPEGDAQHWWLPHTGQGVRTRISDDRLWLPFVVANYLEVTGDAGVLEAQIPFLDGPPLAPGQHESFSQPGEGAVASLYEHCARAIDVSLTAGPHGLPLVGTGDWNDGMNRVGEQGRGESVWLGWFTVATLAAFAPIAEARADRDRVARWRDYESALRAALEREAWDGDWYRRGWFDDGTPLGSAQNEECRIDAIAQSWAVLSGAGAEDRARRAMAAVERELILSQDGLALLFTPPFDRTTRDPGYIKGYPPGVRENGGQYTHAALWSVMAFVALGEGDKAGALFSLINPIHHTRTRTDTHRYKAEPYVVAGDVYAAAPHVGRAGWSWYTGSAGWMLRAGLESILGLRLRAGFLEIDPCIPRTWPRFEVTLLEGDTRYEIRVQNPGGVSRGVASARLDGVELDCRPVRAQLTADGATHRIDVLLG